MIRPLLTYSFNPLTLDNQVYPLCGHSEAIVSHAGVDASVVAVQRDDLQCTVRHLPIAARVSVDLKEVYK